MWFLVNSVLLFIYTGFSPKNSVGFFKTDNVIECLGISDLSDPDPNGGKIMDPDPNSMYLYQQNCSLNKNIFKIRRKNTVWLAFFSSQCSAAATIQLWSRTWWWRGERTTWPTSGAGTGGTEPACHPAIFLICFVTWTTACTWLRIPKFE